MRGGEFADLKAFCAVAQELSFARASARLGISSPALSQTIRALEDRLGVRLFHRTTRSVAVTETGRLLYDRVAPLFSGFQDALAEATAQRATPAGQLRINMPRIAAQHLICPKLSAFHAAHPAIELEIAVDDRISDIIADGFDAGIRLGERLEKDMIAVRLSGEMRMAAVASPSYLAQHGVPATPADLRNHRCLRFRWPTSGTIYDWEFERGNETLEVSVAGPLTVNDTAAMTEAALSGLGIAYCLEIESRALIEQGKLQHILADWSPRFPGFYLYHSSRRLCPPPLSAFIEFFALTSSGVVSRGRSGTASPLRPT